MSSRAIKPKRDGVQASAWQPVEERAPSVLREEGPTFARYLAVASLMMITLGGASLIFRGIDKPYLIPSGWGLFLLAVGLSGLLFHAYSEKDFQFRRLYLGLGVLLFIAAAALRIIPIGDRKVGDSFLPYGGFAMLLSLGFLLSFVKNESEQTMRTYVLNGLGLAALANVLAGIIGGGLLAPRLTEAFLMPSGVIHLILGLLFAMGYVGMQGLSTPRGFWGGRAIGFFGAAMFLIALGRSLWPWLTSVFGWNAAAPSFFLPSGLVLMYFGVEYFLVYLGICSDNKLVVLTRRELTSFFYSPIAYIVLIGMALAGWLNFLIFVLDVFDSTGAQGPRPIPEPIFFQFMVSFLAVIPLIFLVPIITMRMISEEKRAGTIEVLLTAPVNEWQIVISKFLAGLRVFILCWFVWGAFFIALRIDGDAPFDYRPMITFMIALGCMGAGFVAMGLFFSSVTQHQILSAVLTFVMMLALTLLYMLNRFTTGELAWLNTLITYVSYLDLWITSARGTITPRLLVLHATVAAFWLFLSIKVLEARKWS